jgi:hypothetical protein
MTKMSILEAVNEAERFLKRAQDLMLTPSYKAYPELWPSRESAALRRASLDLTRALAAMRRGR